MNIGTISMRYAKALFEYAKEQDAEVAVYENMLQLRSVLAEYRHISMLLKNPNLTEKEKVGILCGLVTASPQYERFAALLVKEGRENMLLYIAYAYIDIYRATKGILELKVITAAELSPGMCAKIKAFVEEKSCLKVEINNVVDDAIIGGVVFEAGDKRLDASVKNQLAEIKKTLVKTVRKLV